MKWDGYKNEFIMILFLKFGYIFMKYFFILEEENYRRKRR